MKIKASGESKLNGSPDFTHTFIATTLIFRISRY